MGLPQSEKVERKATTILRKVPGTKRGRSDFLKGIMQQARQKRKIGKKLYVMVVGDEGVGKTSLLHQWCYRKYSLWGPTKGIRKFPSGWKREAACVYEYTDRHDHKSQYRMGSRRIYDYDAHGVVVIVDASKPFQEILNQARKWRRHVREIPYHDQVDAPDGGEESVRVNIPLFLVLAKADLVTHRSSQENQLLDQLMQEEENHHGGYSGYSGWYYLSAKTEGPNVNEKLYEVLSTVAEFHGWNSLPPNEKIVKEEL